MLVCLFPCRKPFFYPGVDAVSVGFSHSTDSESRRRQEALWVGRGRLLIIGSIFMLAFAVIAGRLLEITVFTESVAHQTVLRHTPRAASAARADITDRNGAVLATNLPIANLYANARAIDDPHKVTREVVRVLPGMNFDNVLSKLTSGKSFVYLKRALTPHQQSAINRRGIQGLSFEKGERRVYPYGPLAAHVIGVVDIDNRGIAGLEKTFNERLNVKPRQPLQVALDMRLQHILREELQRSVDMFRAAGGAGVISDVHTGEIQALVSLPDFNPNSRSIPKPEAQFNRATLGVYEMGSTFKLFTAAAALDGGFVRLGDRYDVTHPIKIAQFTIRDYHPQRRWLTVPEIMIHSSNIGVVKMVQAVGTQAMQSYLGNLGLLQQLSLELPETSKPLIPSPWREINTLTIAYGHGLAVTPAHMATAIGTLVNGGVHYPATLIRRRQGIPSHGKQMLKTETSWQMRWLMRQVVEKGTGAKAEIAGYCIGGKTGTAEKSRQGSYANKALLASFAAAFPMDDPRYAVIVVIDEPEGQKKTFGYATGGWTAAPAVGRIVARMAPIVGIAPVHTGWGVDGPPPQ